MVRNWITDVVCDPDVEHKIWTKHKLTLDDIKSAVCFLAGEEERWDVHPVYGGRWLVKGTSASGVTLIAFLRVEDEHNGVWRCGTAMRESEMYG
jgi:hypothetical protein